MKKIFSFLMACILVTAVSAQTETSEKINYGNRITKGTVLLTGDINFSSTSNNFSGNSEFGINLRADLALSKRYALGLGVGYFTNRYIISKNTTSETEAQNDALSIVPAFTIFGNVLFGWLQPTAKLSIPISFGGGQEIPGQSDKQFTSYGGILSGGLNIYLTRKLALKASLGLISYSQTSYEDLDDTDNRFSIGLSPNRLNFGLLYLLKSE